MASKTSEPVYIRKDILKKIETYLKTAEGKKIAIRDPKKVIPYLLTKYLEERS